VDSEHFIPRTDLTDFFEGRNFYHMLRKKHDVLMEGDQPQESGITIAKTEKITQNHKPTAPLVF
jgi:deoxyribodipyrimidine photolyase-related protein